MIFNTKEAHKVAAANASGHWSHRGKIPMREDIAKSLNVEPDPPLLSEIKAKGECTGRTLKNEKDVEYLVCPADCPKHSIASIFERRTEERSATRVRHGVAGKLQSID